MSDIRLGTINGSHGIKGWVKVFSYTDPIEAILEYSPWILRRGEAEKSVSITDGRINGKKLVAQLEGVETRELAEDLVGYEVYVPAAALPELEDGEFYWFELQGLAVRNEAGLLFGTIDHMLETGANDVMVVHPTSDSMDDQQRLIPFVEGGVVKQVDPSVGVVIVDWEPDY